MQPTSNEEVYQALEQGLSATKIDVSGDGYNYQATVVSEEFENLNKVKRHQKVYALLKEYITSGQLHALTINTFTPEEYENQ